MPAPLPENSSLTASKIPDMSICITSSGRFLIPFSISYHFNLSLNSKTSAKEKPPSKYPKIAKFIASISHAKEIPAKVY